MKSNWQKAVARSLIVSMLLGPVGCRNGRDFVFDHARSPIQPFEMQIEYPDVNPAVPSEVSDGPPPLTVQQREPEQYWELSLDDVIRLTLENSQVIRDLGGRVITAPDSVPSIYDPALVHTDPRFGVDAALADFDAGLAANLFFDRDERTLNNPFFGGGNTSLDQNSAGLTAEVSKTAATGTRFALRNVTDYTRNNAQNLFPSAYFTVIEAEARHPLLQGRGIAFNRIAGPFATPGNYNGVLLARINTDVALADFELATRNLLREVEQTYWLLYFTYRNLDARLARRAQILERWRNIHLGLEVQRYSLADEAPVREQYYLAQAEVIDALNGSPRGGIAVGGFGVVGVYQVERQLRSLMGLPPNDGRLIRPSDEPLTVRAVFDWNESVEQALVRRIELRRQLWTIKRRELELLAARNFLMPRLDIFGLYRWRGFGDDLLGSSELPNGSAFGDLFNGHLEGWQLGLQANVPIGNRIGNVAVRNAELQLARARALLRDQQRLVVSQVSESFAELERAMLVSRANYNRSWAARQRRDTARAKYEAGNTLLEIVLDAEALVTEADSEFYRSLVQYTQAVSGVHYSRGTYLDYLGVYLSEGPWSDMATRAAARQARRFQPRHLADLCVDVPGPVSQGTYGQRTMPLLEVVPEEAMLSDNGAIVPEVPELPEIPLNGDIPPNASPVPAVPPGRPEDRLPLPSELPQ